MSEPFVLKGQEQGAIPRRRPEDDHDLVFCSHSYAPQLLGKVVRESHIGIGATAVFESYPLNHARLHVTILPNSRTSVRCPKMRRKENPGRSCIFQDQTICGAALV